MPHTLPLRLLVSAALTAVAAPSLPTTLISLVPALIGFGIGLILIVVPRWFGFWMTNRAADLQQARNIAAAADAEARQHNARIAELLMTAATTAPPDKILETVERLAGQLAVSSIGTTGQEQPSSVVSSLVEDYHRQALTQAHWQFILSAIAAVTGLAAIVIVALLTTTASTSDAMLRSVPGLVTEAIAALFFSQARDTRRRATELFDRLRADNMRRQALTVANAIDDATLRDTTRASIAMTLAQLLVSDSHKLLPTPAHGRGRVSAPTTSGRQEQPE